MIDLAILLEQKQGFAVECELVCVKLLIFAALVGRAPIIKISVFLMLLRSPMSCFRWLSAIGCLGIVLLGQAAQSATVNGVRVWRAPDHTRIVLDLDAPVQHSLTLAGNPDRIILDVPNSALTAGLS